MKSKIKRFGNYESDGEKLTWSVDHQSSGLVKLRVSDDGTSCDVIPINYSDETIEVVVTASSSSGLKAASVLSVAPEMLEAPQFKYLPKLTNSGKGRLTVEYQLDMRFEDQSVVSWFRCSDSKGSNPVEVAVSRLNKPFLDYELTTGDIGYFIKVSIAPKHVRCKAGNEVSVVMKKPVSARDVKSNSFLLSTDFRNVSTRNQPKVIPGFWTFYPLESPVPDGRPVNSDNTRDAWYFGEGSDGASNMTGLLQGRYAGLLYTPVGKEFGDMTLTMTVTPFKTAGQGFSVAPLYMDVLVKFNTITMTGYALRFIRTTKYHDAVDCVFVRYDNGKIREISKPISTSCFIPGCQIIIETVGNKLTAHAKALKNDISGPERKEVLNEINMETEIFTDKSGGFGIQYLGGSSTLINQLKVEWKK